MFITVFLSFNGEFIVGQIRLILGQVRLIVGQVIMTSGNLK